MAIGGRAKKILYFLISFFPKKYNVKVLAKELKNEITKKCVKLLKLLCNENKIAPIIEIIKDPKNAINNNSFFLVFWVWKATVLPEKILFTIIIIEMFNITKAISPRPSDFQICVVKITIKKLINNIEDLENIVFIELL